jgi:hypothetical protein
MKTRLWPVLVASCCVGSVVLADETKQTPRPETLKAELSESALSKSESEGQRPVLEVAFVLDTTSSMTGLIEGAKQKIWSIASRMASGKPTPRIRVGLVAYRDRQDAYITKVFDLTEDLDAVYQNLRSLKAEGGGDMPEHVGQGLTDAVTRLHWSDDKRAAKMIFVVGDAPGQNYGDGITATSAARKAISRGIVVNTIRCGAQADTAKEFQEVARLADGRFITIEQSGGMVALATPFDAEMSKLNAAIASTAIYAGSERARSTGAASARALAAMEAPAAADRAAFLSKRVSRAPAAAPAEVAGLGGIDLTLAPEKAETITAEALPTELRGMDRKELQAAVEKKAQERKQLEGQLTQLAKKREAWIADNAKSKKDSFDDQVFESVKARAAKVGVTY